MINMVFPRRAIFLTALFLLLPTLVMIIVYYNLPEQLNLLQQEIQSQAEYNKISSDTYHLTNSVQEYILSGDIRALADFHRYSEELFQNEIKMYNLAGQPRKKDLAELIALNKTYCAFVDREVVRGKKTNLSYNSGFLQQNHDLSLQLATLADSLAGVGWEEKQASVELIAASLAKKGLLVLPLSLLSLGSVLLLLLLAWPWLVRCLCLDIAADDSPESVIIVDRRERLLYLNRSAENLFNLSPKAISGKSLGEILTLYPYLQDILQPFHHALSQNSKISNHCINYTQEEDGILLTVDCTPVYLFQRLSGAVLVVSKTRKPKEASILLETIEKERKRLSIEIHDWIGRYMSGIIHGVDYVLRGSQENTIPPQMKENLVILRTQCQNAAIDMRSIMNDIHPYLIEKMGLIPALESYSDNFERLHSKKIYMFYRHRVLRLDREKEILVYRIIQEALTNVVKHSPATEVDIHFTETNDALKIEIIDNGEIEETASPSPGKGLWGMKERARLAGGDLKYGLIDGSFCITLTIPLTEGGKADEQDRNHAG